MSTSASLVAQVGAPGDKVRVITFSPNVPIAERLIPQDRTVVVTKYFAPPFVPANFDQPLDETIDEQTRLHDTVVVAQGLSSSGKLIDNGTWVQSTVRGNILELIKSDTLATNAKRVEFWHDDGETFVKNVRVCAGVYPVFESQERYLLFLGRDHQGDLYLSQSFRLTKGILGSVLLSNGEVTHFTGPMPGKSEQAILQGLRKAARK